MVSSTFLSSFISYLSPHYNSRNRRSSARVFCETPSPSQAFEVDLAQNLATLAPKDIPSTDLITVDWMCKALDVVISTQESVKQALRTCPTSVSATHSRTEIKMMQQYMEDCVKMLDVCCLLKDALAGADAYVQASHLAFKRLQGSIHQGGIQRAKHALLSAKRVQDRFLGGEPGAFVRADVKAPHSTKRLSACSSMLRRMGDNLTAPPAETLHTAEVHTASIGSSSCSSANALLAALYGAEMSALFFLRLLSTALSSPGSCPRRSSSMMTPLHVSGQPAWAPSLLSLQDQLITELLKVSQRRTHRCLTLLPQFHILDASLDQIYEALFQVSSSKKVGDDMRKLVESTSMLAVHVQGSMARLQHQVDCIASSLVDIRVALLDLNVGA